MWQPTCIWPQMWAVAEQDGQGGGGGGGEGGGGGGDGGGGRGDDGDGTGGGCGSPQLSPVHICSQNTFSSSGACSGTSQVTDKFRQAALQSSEHILGITHMYLQLAGVARGRRVRSGRDGHVGAYDDAAAAAIAAGGAFRAQQGVQLR